MPGYEIIGEEELSEVQDVFEKGGILFRHSFDALRNNCYKVKEFERIFGERFNVENVLAVTSGTAALRVALAALDLNPEDEVITQSFTFVATVEAIIESRATPVCVDIDETLNMSPCSLEKSITAKTKAVIVVHMLGNPAKLVEIKAICDKYNLYLIEDTAWGCGGSLHNKSLGTWGDIGTFSFDFAKTMTTGEGGMVIFKDKCLFKKAFAWHDHGHENNPTVPRWEDTRSGSGFNFRMMELQGAVGIAQLKKLSYVIKKQRENRDKIWDNIKDLPHIKLRKSIDGSFDTADALVFFVPNKEIAKKCRKELLSSGLSTKILPEAYSWHFAGTWDHMKELYKRHDSDLISAFSNSDDILSRSVALPVVVKQSPEIPSLVRSSIVKAFN